MATKKCPVCKEHKPLNATYFCRHSKRPSGFNGTCKTCVNEAQNGFNKKNPAVIRARAAKWKKDNPIRYKIREYKASAKKRGLAFPLTHEQVENLVTQPCHFCGTPSAGGIDRKDNSQGYLLENCLPCCQYCNRAKYTRTYDEFEGWIARLIEFRK